ncbi:MAG TPA: response regulator [Opitutaceae bacterium]|nr:response regulator [Opitutaceae bacterium]
MHILVADDDKVSRELLRRILESTGSHTVTLATDGEEAWWLLRDIARHFDLCVLDIMMPRADGLDLVERMRTTEWLKETPVILCSSANDRPTVERAALLSVNHYIVKPYTRAIVLEKVHLVERELTTQDALEDRTVICERLGVDAETCRTLLESLVADVQDWLANARRAPSPNELQKLAVRANGLKGACLSLGALRIAHQLREVETAVTTPTKLGLPDSFAPTQSELIEQLDALDREIGRVVEQLHPPA